MNAKRQERDLERLQRDLNRHRLTLAFVRDSDTGKDYVCVELDGRRVSDWHEVPRSERDPVVA